MKQHYDIIIIGGGMVGLAAALALAPSQLSIGIVEGQAPQPSKDNNTYDLRVIAVNQASINFFTELNVWQSMVANRVSVFNSMAVWADNSSLEFSAADINEPELGYIVENSVIRETLWQKASDNQHIDLLCPLQLTSVEINDQVTVTAGQQRFTCDLIIGADGANSWLRQQCDFKMKTRGYNHHALVATVATEYSHQQTAWQHFLSSGPLAFLPLTDSHHCSIVWSSAPEHIDTLKQYDEDEFNRALSQAFDHKLGNCHVISPRVSFPLQMQHLTDYVAPHVAFIGDAAHRIHPLAGQGANLGFMDAKCLATNILQAIEHKQAFNKLSTLKKYQRERKYYNTKMLAMMDGIKQLFGTSSPTISTLRNMGMEQLNKHSLLKRFFSEQAL